MEKVVVDSDVLIDLLRNEPGTTALIKSLETTHELGATDINAFELYWGAYKAGRWKAK